MQKGGLQPRDLDAGLRSCLSQVHPQKWYLESLLRVYKSAEQRLDMPVQFTTQNIDFKLALCSLSRNANTGQSLVAV